jgi:hypothetical protein
MQMAAEPPGPQGGLLDQLKLTKRGQMNANNPQQQRSQQPQSYSYTGPQAMSQR